jgi:hypothetical protein
MRIKVHIYTTCDAFRSHVCSSGLLGTVFVPHLCSNRVLRFE